MQPSPAGGLFYVLPWAGEWDTHTHTPQLQSNKINIHVGTWIPAQIVLDLFLEIVLEREIHHHLNYTD